MVDQVYTKRYDHALQVMKTSPYGQWREYSAEDTLRFAPPGPPRGRMLRAPQSSHPREERISASPAGSRLKKLRT